MLNQPVLGIESSCDETAASVVVGSRVLSSIIASQTAMHEKWGGVVPEAAARAHVQAILPVILEALEVAGVGFRDLAGVTVTNRPGLIGALSVGVVAAKTLSLELGLPVVGVHHLEGHLVSPMLDAPPLPYPHLSLIASGGHTEVVLVRAPFEYEIVAETLDDAAGEAFDKSARLMGLGIPGGAAIQREAARGNPRRYPLPRGVPDRTNAFSFSGLKTAVLRVVESSGPELVVADLCASVQEAIVDALSRKVLALLEQSSAGCLCLVGGVAANVALRERLEAGCARLGATFRCPEMRYCTDNAAMIALAGSMRLASGFTDDLDLDCYPNAGLP